MKIILTDNFNRENVADELIVENVDKIWGDRIVDALNALESENSSDYFRLVEDDYRLWRGMEDLV